MVDMDSPQRAVTPFLTLSKSRMAAGRHFEKGKSPQLSRYFRNLHQIWYDSDHGQPATSPDVIFGLHKNPRWLSAAILKNEKSQ